jgi:hypothetical protein
MLFLAPATFELPVEAPDAAPYSAKDVISATVLSHPAKLPH